MLKLTISNMEIGRNRLPRKLLEPSTWNRAGADHVDRVGLTWDMLQGCSWRIACWPPRTCRASCRRRASPLFSPHPRMSFRARVWHNVTTNTTAITKQRIYILKYFFFDVNINKQHITDPVSPAPVFLSYTSEILSNIRNEYGNIIFFNTYHVLQQYLNSISWSMWPNPVSLR
jgi:hypothetical protein